MSNHHETRILGLSKDLLVTDTVSLKLATGSNIHVFFPLINKYLSCKIRCKMKLLFPDSLVYIIKICLLLYLVLPTQIYDSVQNKQNLVLLISSRILLNLQNVVCSSLLSDLQ